jgi:putative membrane protein
MQRAILLAGVCAFLAAPAFAQTPAPQTTEPQTAAPTAEQSVKAQPAQEAAPSTADFVKTATIAGMFEIQSSKVALLKRVRSDRAFAEHMIHDHSIIGAELKRLVKRDRLPAEIPAKLDDEHQQMLDKLRKESGADFDKDYDQMQLKGHREAVALFQRYAQSGDNPALRSWAAKTLLKLQDHLTMAEKLSSR